ncbi:hypothetical protein HNP86_001827 [Methanococcus maripaludis]|uniref:Periplasmic copper-binding protein NosD beta helix domain-containing protein n=1 Tax=Methanococcus maripaludis TaxID=39152 RepID=A0A7J9NVG5_METMI|nr:NosD domain-containing protein [Methanococcus maripaludis]MBA2851668.1 hypothetical protein [Methanococcus maripaludis]
MKPIEIRKYPVKLTQPGNYVLYGSATTKSAETKNKPLVTIHGKDITVTTAKMYLKGNKDPNCPMIFIEHSDNVNIHVKTNEGAKAVVVESSENITISGSIKNSDTGILLNNSHNIVVQNTELLNGLCGIEFIDCTNLTVKDVIIDKSTCGLCAHKHSAVNLNNVKIKNSMTGILVMRYAIDTFDIHFTGCTHDRLPMLSIYNSDDSGKQEVERCGFLFTKGVNVIVNDAVLTHNDVGAIVIDSNVVFNSCEFSYVNTGVCAIKSTVKTNNCSFVGVKTKDLAFVSDVEHC